MSNDEETGLPKLANAVQEWMNNEEWEDDLELSEDGLQSRVAASFSINGQPHKLYFETDEAQERFSVYMYSPYVVPPARMPEMAVLINLMNINWVSGRFACGHDEDSNPVQFHWSVLAAGGELLPAQVGVMVGAAVAMFERYGEALALCALTKQQALRIWTEFNERQQADKTVEEDGPSEL